MKIQILYFEGCPNHTRTVDLVRDVVRQQQIDSQIHEIEVAPGEIEELRFFGSPTVQVDGLDIEPAARGSGDFGYGCRMYGASGTPPRELIEAAVTPAD